MKKSLWIILVLFLSAVLLPGCKAKEATPTASPTPIFETPSYTRWEYLSMPARCGVDTGTRDMVCYIIELNDNTLLSNFLQSKGLEGWELAGIAPSTDDEGMLQTFIFKRPISIP